MMISLLDVIQINVIYLNTKEKYPEIRDHEVTCEFILRRYLNERTTGKKTFKIAKQLVQDYEDLRSDVSPFC